MRRVRRRLTGGEIVFLLLLLAAILLAVWYFVSEREDRAELPAAEQAGPAPGEELYDYLHRQLQARQDTVLISGADIEEVKTAFKSVVADDPALFWLQGGCELVSRDTRSGPVIALEPYCFALDELGQKEAELAAAVDRVLGALPPDATAYDKVLFIHDYIVETTEYESDVYDLYMAEEEIPPAYAAAFTAYGCLVGRRAVCEGYAKAFQLLMDRIGVPCGRVTGRRMAGGGHTWNYITLAGEEYYVDVTWDDPVFENKTDSRCSHAFCCITTEELLATHTLDEDQYIPACTSETFDYYRMHGLYLGDASLSRAALTIAGHAGEGIVEIKFRSGEQRDQVIEQLFKNGGITQFADLGDYSSISYTENTADRVLSFRIE